MRYDLDGQSFQHLWHHQAKDSDVVNYQRMHDDHGSDGYNGIHPKYKHFGMTGMNVAYEDKYFTAQSTTSVDRQ